jgi:hypothetical protein
MTLLEIILNASVLLGIVLFIVIMFSYFSSRMNRRADVHEITRIRERKFTNSAQIQNLSIVGEETYHTGINNAQLELLLKPEKNELQISHREEIVKEYFEKRKKYTVINPPYQTNIRRASNF